MDEKEERGNYVRVGALIFTGLALLAFVIFSIGNTTHPFQTIYKLETRFTRVNGLQKGAPVTLSGVTIGTVESIDFPKDRKATYVIVRMKIEGSATERIRADSVVNIRTMGLLGDKFIDISPGSQTAPIAPANYVLRSKDPIDYEAILGGKGTGDFLSNIMQASDSMSRILADIDRGNGLLSQLIHGERQGREANEFLEARQHHERQCARPSAIRQSLADLV